jgi:hypothetical protein
MRRIKAELTADQSATCHENKRNFPLNKRDLPLTGPRAAALMHSFNATRRRQGHGADGEGPLRLRP